MGKAVEGGPSTRVSTAHVGIPDRISSFFLTWTVSFGVWPIGQKINISLASSTSPLFLLLYLSKKSLKQTNKPSSVKVQNRFPTLMFKKKRFYFKIRVLFITRERQRSSMPWLTPRWQQHPALGQAKARISSQVFHQVLPHGGTAWTLGPSSVDFPSLLARSQLRSGAVRTQATWNTNISGSSGTHWVTVLASANVL